MTVFRIILPVLLSGIFISSAAAQPLFQPPRLSPRATVSQTIGVTDITITYSRPGVKGRKIWGELVPYGKVWRTGANENTTISFSDTVYVEGNKLPPGLFGLQTIPGENEWTVIFSRDAKMWGAFSYKEENDALRIKVTPRQADFLERMMFSLADLTDSSATVALQWEKLKIGFNVSTKVENLTIAKARSVISWGILTNAALYCVEHNINLDEAMKWSDAALALQENYSTLRVKARLLERTGKKKDAVATMEKAIQLGKAMKEPPFDFAQMEALLAEWKKK